jgi:hypothetical protein
VKLVAVVGAVLSNVCTVSATPPPAQPHRDHIRLFINGGRPNAFVADRFDLNTFGSLTLENLNPDMVTLLYDHFGTMVVAETNRKYAALAEYCAANGLTDDDLENMFLHAQYDVDYTLGEPQELDPPVTKTVPGWDPVNDPNGDGYVDEAEFASRPNPDASARTKSEARIPIYYWGPPPDFLMHVGHPDYQAFLLDYAYTLMTDNEAYDNPAYWITVDPIRVVPEPYSGSYAALIEVVESGVNLLNRQYVTLQSGVTYTVGAMLKTAGLNGLIRVYEYEFDDSERLVGDIEVADQDSDWQFQYLQFRVNSDTYGRITFRFYGGPGNAWLDDIVLAKGPFETYAQLMAQPNLLLNGGFEDGLQTAQYNGLFLDTLMERPHTQGSTVILEYPDRDVYTADIQSFLTDLMNTLSDGMWVVGNGWKSDPFIITGVEHENWARITTSIYPTTLNDIVARDAQGIVQTMQFNPIYDEVANPNRPDMFVEGVTLAQDQMYGLALYYLVHGDYTYFGYGVHGAYSLDVERWFDAVEFDVGQPLGSYYVVETAGPDYTQQTQNILVNGGFETDDDLDGNPDSWIPAEPVELDPTVVYAGNFSAKIASETEINNINRQYVTLEPNTAYTLSGWIKTQNVTGGGAQIYPYEFDDCQECTVGTTWITVNGTTDWTFYNMVFVTGADVAGRINFRIVFGTGTAWFDDLHLTEGRYGGYTVYGRDFEHARVLVNTPYHVGDETFRHYELDETYHAVNINGIPGPGTDRVSLGSGRGAILAREGPDAIPALPGWTGIVMGLLVLTAGTMSIRRHRPTHH